MIYMTALVIFLSFIFSFYVSSSTLQLNLTFYFIVVACVLVFCCNSLLVLYLCYEASLLPIVYIIVKWGSYPERSLSALMLILYTSIFSFPLLFFLFHLFECIGRVHFVLSSTLSTFPSSIFSTLIIFFAFRVKLPLYGIHYWLPIAHVEAPTFGSMILAGVLLKLGGVGMVRCCVFIEVPLLKLFLTSYLFLFLVVVTLVCCFQSDLKRLVAYSSVSHMIAIPILILVRTAYSLKSIMLIMFFHGLSSPAMFMLVGVLYSVYSTRQLACLRGLLLISPLTSLYAVMAFFFTLSAPPFPSFIPEVFFLVSSFLLSPSFLLPLFIFVFLSLLYNLNWLSAVLFKGVNASAFNTNYALPYASAFRFRFTFTFCVVSLVLFSFI